MSNIEEQRKRQQELIDEINTKMAELSQRLDMVERNRQLGSTVVQRHKFLEDSLPAPEHRVTVTRSGEVYVD